VGGARSAVREKLSVDLLMVRDGVTGRFVYSEQLERRPGESTFFPSPCRIRCGRASG
jgi:hypothetical protein